MKLRNALLLSTGLAVFACANAGQANASQSPENQTIRAEALLARAVDYMKSNGDKALAAFSRTSEFTDGELYVYVLSDKGTIEASGGASYHLIGRNVIDYRDSEGKLLFREMLDQAPRDGHGSIQYRWLNLQRGKVERKTAYFTRVDDKVLAVGYYTPRATMEQARAMLWRAVDEVNQRSEAAFTAFNDISGGFVLDDTYVFVVDIESKRMLAHGAMPRLVGRQVADLADADGKPIMGPMLDMALASGEGELDYRWRNPATGKIENKHTFVRRVGRYMVGVGYYKP